MRSGLFGKLLVLGVGAGLVLSGCGDSNVFEGMADDPSGRDAKVEELLWQLDKGDDNGAIRAGAETSPEMAEVVRILEDPDPTTWGPATALLQNSPDQDVERYVASAYAGRAGVDGLELIKVIADAQEDTSSDDPVVFQAVTKMFRVGDADGNVTAGELDGILEDLNRALFILSAGASPVARVAAAEGPNDEIDFQLGFFSAVRAVLSVVGQLEDPDGSGRLMLEIFETGETVSSDQACVVGAVSLPPPAMPSYVLEDDLYRVRKAVEILQPSLFTNGTTADGSDLARDLDDFLFDLGYLRAGDNTVDGLLQDPSGSDEIVSSEELRDYLFSLLLSSAQNFSIPTVCP